MKKNYYLIRVGDHTRVSELCDNAKEACIYCFGCVLRGAKYKNIGSRSLKYRSAKDKTQMYSDEGWIDIDK